MLYLIVLGLIWVFAGFFIKSDDDDHPYDGWPL